MGFLQFIGIATLSYLLFKVAFWAYSTFFRKVDFQVYKKGVDTWAVVTGASDGIGQGFVKSLAQRGFHIILIGRNREKLEGVVKSLKANFPKNNFEIVLSEAYEDSKDLKRMEALQAKLEPFDIGIVVNNVGIGLGRPGKLEYCEPKELDKLVQVNCTFPMLFTRMLIKKLRDRKHKCAIINIASVAAHLKVPNATVYSATKAFNWAFSRSLGEEYGPLGIEVLCVNPGYVESQLTGMKPGPIVCSAVECSEYALRRMGQEDIIPHWKHALMYAPFSLLTNYILPVNFLSKIFQIFDKTLSMRPKYKNN